ncbi:quinone-dependent dihydroorotate dehydrogenase [Lentilitoribacter sp. Alg239-R112]|jgi:dihydroorotate dehydrogenase|uniref:quinone-dependent dihydroorotate dehydrogenase n=1 Tax=Lentilitoribacter sp. Alg239-R112 TaxID=2305987 RepID=UPI0013A6A770|nr:quinone-dependent dihydroorotate dehydrogenase [Lentilitoribacter sp. Alg239-R112]
MFNPYKAIAQKAFFALDAEKAHGLSIKFLQTGAACVFKPHPDSRLEQSVAGLSFPNPVGMAAGYDKNADVPLEILKLGFGFTEVGTITPKPQSGNPKPRIFRLPTDEAVINRLGFNNDGHQAALQRLEDLRGNGQIIGVNIGANKDSEDRTQDYVSGIDTFYKHASYFTANISSPNTPGLRDLQARESLSELLSRCINKRNELAKIHGKRVPIFLKVAPDLTQEGIDDIAAEVADKNIDGVIISNTTLSRSGLKDMTVAHETGGLSGKPVLTRSNIVLAKFREAIGNNMPIIGVGGISDANSAAEKIRAGADLVQLYTGMIYQGPSIAAKICQGLSRICDQQSLANISDIRGAKTEYYSNLEIPK